MSHVPPRPLRAADPRLTAVPPPGAEPWWHEAEARPVPLSAVLMGGILFALAVTAAAWAFPLMEALTQ